MADGRHKDARGADTARGPREGHPAEARSVGPAGVPLVDPELEGELEGELESARAEAAEWRDKAARAQAEFENTRKRLESRHTDALLRAGERIVANLLPVLDDLDRAIDHALTDGTSDVTDGLDAVRRKLLDVLAREGCSVIDPVGETFDPNQHQAVQTREDADAADHTVVEVFQKGYEMHGRVLRPAMVVVATGGPAGG